MDSQDGDVFIQALVSSIKTHKEDSPQPLFGFLTSAYQKFISERPLEAVEISIKPDRLLYLLARFEHIGMDVGPVDVSLVSPDIMIKAPPSEFSSTSSELKTSGGVLIRAFGGISTLLKAFESSRQGIARQEMERAREATALKDLYSAFSKVSSLKLTSNTRGNFIRGCEGFPVGTVVPLDAFKNLSTLEICDIDIRHFFGWDRVSDHLHSLTVTRGLVNDVADLLLNLVLDDMDKRQGRSSKQQAPASAKSDWSTSSTQPSPSTQFRSNAVSSPSGVTTTLFSTESASSESRSLGKDQSRSGNKPSHYIGSDGQNSKTNFCYHSNLLSTGILPSTKWKFLKHLGLPKNELSSITSSALSPVATTLQSLDLSGNLFFEIPDCIGDLKALKALNMSNCQVMSLHSLAKNPLTAITSLNLRSNRLWSLNGLQYLDHLEMLDVRDNMLARPMEVTSLTMPPLIQKIWVAGNSFVMTHKDYRVSIFNSFRMSSRLSIDVVIDGYGPSSSELRQLIIQPIHKTDFGAGSPLPDDRATAGPSTNLIEEAPIVSSGNHTLSHKSKKDYSKKPEEGMLRDAIKSGDLDTVRNLVIEKFELVAQYEYAWLYELNQIGYTREEIADLLIEEAKDAPWIIFERQDIQEVAIDLHHHQPSCVHRGSQNLSSAPELIGSVPDENTTGRSIALTASAHGDFSRLIQELCGIGGVVPISPHREEWNGHVSFDDQLIASVTIVIPKEPTLEPQQLLSRIGYILDGFCNAISHVQKADLMCQTFSILCGVPSTALSPAPDYVEVSLVELAPVIHFRETLSSLMSQPESNVAKMELDHSSREILSPLGLEAHPYETPTFDQVVHICSLAVQYLCLGLLSYSRAHSGAIQPFFLDCPLRHIRLLGSSMDSSTQHIDVRLQELTCMGDMTQDAMVVFRWADNESKSPQSKFPQPARYDLLASPEDIMDTWGPGQFVTAPDEVGYHQIYAIKIGGGTITANAESQDQCSSTGHWSSEPVTTPFVRSFDRKKKSKVEVWVRIRKFLGKFFFY